jgi:L-rhamnose mutarotase
MRTNVLNSFLIFVLLVAFLSCSKEQAEESTVTTERKVTKRVFSIFLHQFDNGKYYLFGYYEYTGNDFEADMAEIARKERNIAWLKVCDPMQIPFEGKSSWSEMEQVYYNK